MKSYVKSPFDKAIFFMDSSNKFLENERTINVLQRAVPPTGQKVEEIPELSKHISDQQKQTKSNSISENSLKMKDDNQMLKSITTETHIDTSGTYPKRYVTKCYFEPRQVPVKYSETMIVKIGSKKKQYFETTYYENKLEPNRWREQMTMRIPAVRSYDQKSEIEIPLQNDNVTPLLQPKTIISEL